MEEEHSAVDVLHSLATKARTSFTAPSRSFILSSCILPRLPMSDVGLVPVMQKRYPFMIPQDHSMSTPLSIQGVAMNITSHTYKTSKIQQRENSLEHIIDLKCFVFRFPFC